MQADIKAKTKCHEHLKKKKNFFKSGNCNQYRHSETSNVRNSEANVK